MDKELKDLIDDGMIEDSDGEWMDDDFSDPIADLMPESKLEPKVLEFYRDPETGIFTTNEDPFS